MTISGKPTGGDALASLRALAEELGWWRALQVGLETSNPVAMRALFEPLGPADDEREVASRQQAGPAILLYRALKRRIGQEDALRITGRVVQTGALRFLGRQLRDLDPVAFSRSAPAQREAAAQGWLDAFFTAQSRLDAVSEQEVRFTVTRCALHRAAVDTGHPELAPVFCRADAAFFAALQPPIALHRPSVLADGDESCHFQLRMMPGERNAEDRG